jgi:hypothetical protein
MALQSSGAISLSDIQDEFGGSNPISLSEYYRDGSYVTSNNTGVPTSGQIQFDDFYGAVRQFSYTFSSSVKEVNLNSTLTAAGWNGSDPVTVTIASGVYLWSDNTSVGGLTISSAFNGLLTITNNGYIIGRGGNGGNSGGAGANGGPALVNQASGVVLTNASGAYIAGGGGGGRGVLYAGGGGGAGGGNGGSGYYAPGGSPLNIYGGTGGAIGQSGTAGAKGKDSVYAGQGGGAGGGGGDLTTWFDGGGSGGGGGGRILPGTGGAGGVNGNSEAPSNGGAGGSAGNAAPSGAAGQGGGGWGAAGGGNTGGSGGAAISGTAIATFTNNGTVYGSVA